MGLKQLIKISFSYHALKRAVAEIHVIVCFHNNAALTYKQLA